MVYFYNGIIAIKVNETGYIEHKMNLSKLTTHKIRYIGWCHLCLVRKVGKTIMLSATSLVGKIIEKGMEVIIIKI